MLSTLGVCQVWRSSVSVKSIPAMGLFQLQPWLGMCAKKNFLYFVFLVFPAIKRAEVGGKL